MVTFEWPRMALSVLTSHPASTHRVANVWRRPWNVTASAPSRLNRRANHERSERGSAGSGPPLAVVDAADGAPHVESPGGEVHVLPPEAAHLAYAQPGAQGQHHAHAVRRRGHAQGGHDLAVVGERQHPPPPAAAPRRRVAHLPRPPLGQPPLAAKGGDGRRHGKVFPAPDGLDAQGGLGARQPAEHPLDSHVFRFVCFIISSHPGGRASRKGRAPPRRGGAWRRRGSPRRPPPR